MSCPNTVSRFWPNTVSRFPSRISPSLSTPRTSCLRRMPVAMLCPWRCASVRAPLQPPSSPRLCSLHPLLLHHPRTRGIVKVHKVVHKRLHKVVHKKLHEVLRKRIMPVVLVQLVPSTIKPKP